MASNNPTEIEIDSQFQNLSLPAQGLPKTRLKNAKGLAEASPKSSASPSAAVVNHSAPTRVYHSAAYSVKQKECLCFAEAHGVDLL
jgi:hypothetical protein